MVEEYLGESERERTHRLLGVRGLTGKASSKIAAMRSEVGPFGHGCPENFLCHVAIHRIKHQATAIVLLKEDRIAAILLLAFHNSDGSS